MLKYLATRFVLMIPTLIGISIVVFLMVLLAPGRPSSVDSGAEGAPIDPELLEAKRRILGLDKPLPVQYWNWMSKMVTLDLGESMIEHRPIRNMIGERLGLTIRLNLLSLSLIYLISIPLGLIAAKNRYAGPTRRLIFDTSSGVVLLVLYSVPTILAGSVLQLTFSQGGILQKWGPSWLQWLVMPIAGIHSSGSDAMLIWPYVGDSAWHLVLPVLTLSLVSLAFMSKIARNSLLENLRLDYVRTARAKGLRERTVVYVHALRNSLLAMITILSGILPALFGGSIIVEHIFGLPGMGKLYYDSIMQRDYPMIMGISMIAATLTLISILLADILYAVVDPRIRYE